ncbi:MAG: GNAT family N-acetyltransferase [Cyanobacteria bacterium P01_H01_bin.162]
MALQSRSFRSGQDVAALHQLVIDCWQAKGPAVTFHIGDVCWRLRPQSGRSPERDIRLWYEAKTLQAFAWFDAPDSGDLLCHPEVERDVVEPVLLAWLEGEARLREASHFTVGAFSSDRVREELLIDRGYQKQSSFLHHLQRSLDAPIIATTIADSYSISTTTAADLSSLAIAIADAFGSEPKPVSTYKALRSSRFYRNDLDIVVKAANGEIVAFCLAWLDEHNQIGLLEPVGCHSGYQRLGLASAAVNVALEALRVAGARTAVVYPAGDEPAACKLYEKCGFIPVANDYDWEIAL